ncbi:calcium-activated potassium channel subunit beta-4 isoform X1 [Ursus arctos]|uniref:calcium-activated potassium channel subunit beta-4 isoform X1 n=1 Tax=Ursus arctos TaxID=9644 RepID=UPI002016DF86|nr:calcium-activated potassium channel subunit beta-4 isoform X1 [Ursus arctos]
MAKLRVAYEYTEAEDKSIRLGLFLIISGVVSLFIFGFCWLSPALQDLQATAANCTVLSVQQIGEVFECTFTCGADCRGTSQYPCVQVYVNNSESNSRALLHSDEHQLLTNPKCSYIPPCKRENQKNLESVMNWQQYWKDEIGSQPFTCYFNQFQRKVERWGLRPGMQKPLGSFEVTCMRKDIHTSKRVEQKDRKSQLPSAITERLPLPRLPTSGFLVM